MEQEIQEGFPVTAAVAIPERRYERKEIEHKQFNNKIIVKGKFFFTGNEKFYIKGVTYGAFQPDENGQEYYDLEQIERDFQLMARNQFNSVRIPHTTPPVELLDLAQKHGLRVMIGLSAEQYIGYFIDHNKQKEAEVKQIIQDKVREVAGHPALLCIALGNEVCSSIVRWHGRKRVENYLKKIFGWVKEIDSETPVTYVNYPTTEYLQLPFLDFLCFNVYLESKDKFSAYISRLQNLAGNRPLIMGEIGLDTLRNGEDRQASFLNWQVPLTFQLGCAGLFIFSWTDEWFRGGAEVYDWAFGLTENDRSPKQALQVVKKRLTDAPFSYNYIWPHISVIICSYNGSATIGETLAKVQQLEYSSYEVIVVNDGSVDNTLQIASAFPFKIITTPNHGLSHARNIGLYAAKGEIVAYLDDDAYPDPDWLRYLAYTFLTTNYAAVGGPNLLPENAGLIANCVDNTPGAPTHILLTDEEAEHIPGCNMAFLKARLLMVGGFDTTYRVAGDDVDICWKFQEAGLKIGFSPAALVWHHRRNSIKRFWKQQVGYGKAEALLEKKWPQKYNTLGHTLWGGCIYGNGNINGSIFNKGRVYHGVWGMAPFQSIYHPGASGMLSFTLMPEWYLVVANLALLSGIGFIWKPMFLFVPVMLLCCLLPMIQIFNKVNNIFNKQLAGKPTAYKTRFSLITYLLHALQPMARLWGRISFDLTPWRRSGPARIALPVKRKINIWCEEWIEPEIRLRELENKLLKKCLYIWRGGSYDRWDMAIKGGEFGHARVCMAAEDHKGGKQYLRFRITPHLSHRAQLFLAIYSTLIIIAALSQSLLALAVFCFIAVLILVRSLIDCSVAANYWLEALRDQKNN